MNARAVETIYRLTPMQEGLLFHSLSDPEIGLYVEQATCTLEGDLDPSLLRRAWERVVAHHPALRASFHWRGVERPVQVVRRRVELPWREEDWRGVDGEGSPDPEWLESRFAARVEADRRRGFELERPPLLRLTLVRTGERRWRLLWSYHHLLLDGWSLHLVLRQVFAAYEALDAGHEPRLPPARPYEDYVSFLERRAAEPHRSRAETFWRGELAGFRAATPLPGDRAPAGASRGSLRGRPATASRLRRLDPAVGAALEALAGGAEVTVGTLVQSAWALVLSRWAGVDDVVFGTVVSGRPTGLRDASTMVGLFINTLPVRVRADGDERLVPWLRRLQERLVELREHEQTPLADVHRWSDVAAGEPLFESLLVIENYPRDPDLWVRLGGLTVRDVESLERINYPLGLAFVPGSGWSAGPDGSPGEGPALELTYDPERFGSGDAERLLGCMEVLLDAFGRAADPETGSDPGPRLGDLPLLSPEEERRILVDWNAGERARTLSRSGVVPRTLHGLVAEGARRAPDAVAVSPRRGRPWTYRDLVRRAVAVAEELREAVTGPDEDPGEGPGTEPLVAVFLERSAEAYAALLGALSAGAAYLPLDPDLPDHRLSFMLDDARPAAVVTRRGLRSRLAGTDPSRVLFVEDLGEGAADRTEIALDAHPDLPPERAAYVIYTSGSTGRPKGVVVSHGAAVGFVRQAVRDLDLGPESRVLQMASLGFDASVCEVFATLGSGGRLRPVDRETLLSPAELGETVRELGATLLLAVPSLLAEIPIRDEHDVPTVRTVVSGGDRCPPDVVARWSPGRRWLNAYGPTEATVYCVRHELRGAPGAAATGSGADLGDRHADPPIGRPVAGSRAYVVDRRLRPVPPGAPGELLLGGVQIARGYLGRPALTAERFVPHPFSHLDGRRGERLYRTGDLARLLPEGTLELLGRIDHQVKVRGQRVEPGEVEAVLERHPGVGQCAVVVQGEAPERRLTAFVVPAGGTLGTDAEADAAALRRHLAERLPAAMVPTAFVTVAELPRNAAGKVDRRELALRDAAPTGGAGGRAPADGLESTLARIWAGVLGVERVGADDEFFALGGDSILAIRVISRAAEEGIAMTPRTLFENPTVARLATALAERGEQGEPGGDGAAADRVSGPVPLTPVQSRFFELGVEPPGHWTMPLLLTVREVPLSGSSSGWTPALVARALAALRRRHDALRLRFERDATGSWSQRLPRTDAGREPFSVVDLGALGAAGTECFERALAAASADAQRSLDLGRGPLRSVLLRGPGGEPDRLLVVIHHLAVDAVSWRVLVEELERACRGLAATGGVHLAPPTLPFARWAHRLEERVDELSRSGSMDAERSLWRSQLPDPAAGAPDLPLDGPRASAPETDVEGAAESLSLELDREATASLLDEALHPYRCRPEELILAALARAVARRTGGSGASLLLEGHGRPDDVDLSRTVGWLTVLYPARLEAPPDGAPGEVIKGVKERLRSLAGRAFDYGLLRRAAADGPAGAPAEPSLAFNYLGRVDLDDAGSELFALDPSPPGSPRSPRARRPVPVEVAAWVRAGRLRLAWRFGPSRIRRRTIEALAESHLEELHALVAHCLDPDAGGFTPSDFPAAELDQDALDRLIGRVGGDPPEGAGRP